MSKADYGRYISYFETYAWQKNREMLLGDISKSERSNHSKNRINPTASPHAYNFVLSKYASFPIQEQAQKGEWNYQLSAVYLIGMLDFCFSEEDGAEVRHHVQLRDQKCRVFYDKLTYIYLEMPNFKKTEAELESNFDKWMYVLQQLPHLQNRPRALQERVFQKLFDAAEIAKFTPEEKTKYEESLKTYRDLKNVVDTSFEDGKAEGLEEGFEKGIEQGKIDIARQMKTEGEPLEKIIRFTGLGAADIEKL